MSIVPSPSKVAIAGHPIHAMLVPFPIASFTFALITDLIYWLTGVLFWQNFSAWLLLVGLVFGGLAAVAGLWDLLSHPALRRQKIGWVHGLGNVVVLLLALFNNLVHSRDGWIAVVPTGVILSALTVAVMLFTGWLGGTMVYRMGIGVRLDE